MISCLVRPTTMLPQQFSELQDDCHPSSYAPSSQELSLSTNKTISRFVSRLLVHVGDPRQGILSKRKVVQFSSISKRVALGSSMSYQLNTKRELPRADGRIACAKHLTKISKKLSTSPTEALLQVGYKSFASLSYSLV